MTNVQRFHAHDPHGGNRVFTSTEEVQAHRGDVVVDWDEEYER